MSSTFEKESVEPDIFLIYMFFLSQLILILLAGVYSYRIYYKPEGKIYHTWIPSIITSNGFNWCFDGKHFSIYRNESIKKYEIYVTYYGISLVLPDDTDSQFNYNSLKIVNDKDFIYKLIVMCHDAKTDIELLTYSIFASLLILFIPEVVYFVIVIGLTILLSSYVYRPEYKSFESLYDTISNKIEKEKQDQQDLL